MNAKLAMIGVNLITLGATLTVASYFNVNYWQAQLIYRRSFVIDSNSSSSQYLRLDPKPMSLKQIEVQIKPSYELGDFLNSTKWSTYQLGLGINPIPVTLGDVYQNVSADVQTSYSTQPGVWWMINNPAQVFNIPDNWLYIASITVTNPENYPVIWIVEVTGYSLLINNNWQTAMYLGIASIAVGAVTGISVLIRKPAIKQKETTTVP
jgi:hypothetical protein